MKSICTLVLMALLLFGGSVTSTAQFFSASTESDAYVYFIKGAGTGQSDRYWKYNGGAITHTTTAPTNGDAAYQFKIIASTTEGKYYIYSVGAGQYLYCKEATGGKDKVGLKADKADDALWYIPNDGTVANGIVDFVPGTLTLTDSQLGWNIHGGVGQTEYIGLYERNNDNSKWSLIPADLTTLNNYRSLVATEKSSIMQGDTPDYTKSLATYTEEFPATDFDSWSLNKANSLVSYVFAFYPALPTGYYTIQNCATDRRPTHIYGDITNNPNGYTLQSDNFVIDSRGLWKVVNNGNGTVNIINSNGDPIITMSNNRPTSHTTLHMAAADGGNGIYFTEAINASNGGTKVNNIFCLTTWSDGGSTAPDNRWKFTQASFSPYTVNIYAPSNYTLGWRISGTDGTEIAYSIIKKGGFFVDYSDGTEGSMNRYEFVLLDDKGNVVEGVTPVYNTDARTITATLSELPIGYYRIESAFATSKSITCARSNNTLGWETTDVNNGEQYWYIQGNATDGYTIQSAYFDSKKYMFTTSAGNSNQNPSSLVEESSASKYVISLISNSDQYTIKETGSTSPIHGQYMGDGYANGPLITWSGGANTASAWYLVPTTKEEAAIASLNTYTAGIDFSKQIGTTVGKYSEPEGTTTEGLKELTSNYATYKAEVNAAIASGNATTMETAYNNFKTNVKDLITTERTTAYGNLVINQPVAGKLYRFKGHASNHYICPTNTETGKDKFMAMNANSDHAATVFMLVEGSEGKFKLLNYGFGYYTTQTYCCGANKANANNIQFSESTTYPGYYTMKSDASGVGTWLYDQSSKVNRNGDYVANNCDWKIEEVTWLPIPIRTAYKFGTIVPPADLALVSSDGRTYAADGRLKFYTATIGTDGYVELKKVTENIKAGKHYVVELVTENGMSEGSQFMEITSGAPELSAPNALRGSYETVAKPTNEGTIYTLQAAWDETTDNHLSTSKVAFRQYNGATIQGFRAYLPVANNVRIAGMRIVDGDVTRIEGVNAEESHKVDVYDLSGRRVQRATKGLYIINGKKVIVK